MIVIRIKQLKQHQKMILSRILFFLCLTFLLFMYLSPSISTSVQASSINNDEIDYSDEDEFESSPSLINEDEEENEEEDDDSAAAMAGSRRVSVC